MSPASAQGLEHLSESELEAKCCRRTIAPLFPCVARAREGGEPVPKGSNLALDMIWSGVVRADRSSHAQGAPEQKGASAFGRMKLRPKADWKSGVMGRTPSLDKAGPGHRKKQRMPWPHFFRRFRRTPRLAQPTAGAPGAAALDSFSNGLLLNAKVMRKPIVTKATLARKL